VTEDRGGPTPTVVGFDEVLLDSKLSVPQSRAGFVGRGGLIEAARASGCRVVGVTAPAGYGKSTLLVQWAGAEDRRVAWVSLGAGLGTASEHALISLLTINGLRVSEALGADIDALGIERGHRTLTILRKGGKIVTIPLAPRTARAIDLAIGERADGPIFLRPDRQRMDRHCAGRIVHRVARRAGVAKSISPHTLRHAFITAALDAGVPPRDVQEAASHADPRTTMRYAPGSRWIVTRPTSSPPTRPASPAEPPRPADRVAVAARSAGQTVREREIVLDQSG
jgi:hypothetical protein